MLDGNDALTMTMERVEPTGLDAETGDDALMKRVAAGDRTAFAVLMRRHVDRAHVSAYRIAGNREMPGTVAGCVPESLDESGAMAAGDGNSRPGFIAWCSTAA